VAIDYSTPRGQVRLLIADTDLSRLVLTDDQIDGYLTMNAASVRRSAADALDAIATSEALISKVLRTADGTSTDGAKVADSLRKQAATLRAQADDEDEVAAWDDPAGFGVSEFAPYPTRSPW
jgi:hypothetical protein